MSRRALRLALILAATACLVGVGQARADKFSDAEAAFADGRDSEAISLYSQAIAASAGDPIVQAAAYFGRGEAHIWFGRPALAIADFTAALARQPDPAARANILLSRGEAEGELRAYEPALADYTEALALAPTMIGVHAARGRILQTLKRKDEALADYDAELKLNPDSMRAKLGRADLLGLPRPVAVHSVPAAGTAQDPAH